MKILVLENEPSSARGGQELSLFDVCRGLARRGHDLELLYTEDGNLLDGYRAFCRRVDRVAAYSIDRSQSLRAAIRMLADAVQPGRSVPDVIYANQYMDSPFARLLAWRFGRPFVCHLRLAPPSQFCAQYRWGLRGVSRFIANSARTRDDYVARGYPREHVDVVYNGIDARQWQPKASRSAMRERLGVRPDTFLIAYAGRLHWEKGLDVAIDALAMLAPPADLVIAGREVDDGSGRHYETELRQTARSRGVADRCHFIGHVGSMADLYAAADVTVLSSFSETFGRTLIESMACGTPAVASNVGGMPEVLTGEFADYLVPVREARALADRLERLRGWRTGDPRLADRCRAHAARFDIGRSVEGIEAALQSAVNGWGRVTGTPGRTAGVTTGGGL